ncbi:MAG: hypothetical protein WBG36_00915 [Ornithinimicrobium sp.]
MSSVTVLPVAIVLLAESAVLLEEGAVLLTESARSSRLALRLDAAIDIIA